MSVKKIKLKQKKKKETFDREEDVGALKIHAVLCCSIFCQGCL